MLCFPKENISHFFAEDLFFNRESRTIFITGYLKKILGQEKLMPASLGKTFLAKDDTGKGKIMFFTKEYAKRMLSRISSRARVASLEGINGLFFNGTFQSFFKSSSINNITLWAFLLMRT